MARILLCWELGGGLGHAGRFKPLVQALRQRGHEVELVLRDLVLTRALLADLDVPTFQAPLCLHQTVGLPQPPANLAEELLAQGYLHTEALAGLVAGWRSLFLSREAALIVADYAPTAVLAARSLGLPVVALGGGFSVPPDLSPLPAFRSWDQVPQARLAAAERRALGTVNAVLQQHGAAPLSRLSPLYRGDEALLCTWPVLDPYQRPPDDGATRWLGPNFLPATGVAPTWPPGDGPRVLVYLHGQQPAHLAMLQALAQAGCRTLCYLPEVAAGQAPPVSAPHLAYAQAPVNLDAALAQAALLVCQGGEGTVAQALLAGVPMVLLPGHTEQLLTTQALARAGVALNLASHTRPETLLPQLRAWLQAGAPREAAAGLARALATHRHTAQVETLVLALTRHLPDAGKGNL